MNLWKQLEEDKSASVKHGTDKIDESASMIRQMLTQIERKAEDDMLQR